MHERIVVFDVETTGLDIHHDEIIEFGAWCIEQGQNPVALHFLVRPSNRVPANILRLTGIREEELERANPIETYRQQIIDLFQGSVLVGHNILFDLSVLGNNLGIKFQNDSWDTLSFARILFPGMNYYRLGILAERLGFPELEGHRRHRALHDAWLTWQLLNACWQKGLDYDLSVFDKSEYFTDGWAGKSFFAALRKEVSRRFPDRPLRTDEGLVPAQDGLFADINAKKGVVPEELQWITDCFSSKGELKHHIEGFESRPGQSTMASAVAEALQKSKHLVVEAGTGTGKSYAYLIPGIWWAKKTKSKVVIATHTIPLQEQISEKDFPVLQKVLPFSFNSALLKGKGNYCCLKKWFGFMTALKELSDEEKVASLSILIWLRETLTGDFQELSPWIGLHRIWPLLNAEGEACIPLKCPYSSQCFMLKSRKKADEADVLIVNHSLLFADLKTNNMILPEYDYLIVDEAHHLYETALNQLGDSFSQEKINTFLERVVLKNGSSFYNLLRQRLGQFAKLMPSVAWDRFRQQADELPGLAGLIRVQIHELFQLLETIMSSKHSLRFIPNHRQESWWSILLTQFENLSGRMKALDGCLHGLCELLSGEDDAQELYFEISGLKSQGAGMIEAFPNFLDIENNQRVTWLDKAGNQVIWRTSPVDVSEILREKLFEGLKSVILTSATLSVAGAFKHFIDEIGLPQETDTIKVKSPFSYDEQMSLYVVKDFMRSTEDEEGLAARISGFITDVAQSMDGRTLVLFTSHQLLRTTHRYLQERLNHLNLNLLSQGFDGSRGMILEEFRRNPQSVLLGANSFWEGIDLPGEALRCVIIVKLPFSPPSMPLIEARSDLLRLKGSKPFQDFLLPQAVLRFKQGFGRLIRTKTDQGCVIVLDGRIIEKSYGRTFLKSLPLKAFIQGNAEFILNRIGKHIRSSDTSLS